MRLIWEKNCICYRTIKSHYPTDEFYRLHLECSRPGQVISGHDRTATGFNLRNKRPGVCSDKVRELPLRQTCQ
jgi:hypothetical protein